MVRKSKKLNNETKLNGTLDYPVVGIGASAGGLEAIQEFFKFLPSDINAAFVVIQHLSPDYKSFMNELLSRVTNIPIVVVSDATQIQINHIYLIPPKTTMTIFKGVLYLTELSSIRTFNLPIDVFFRSLAKDQEKNAIGIILSGTGSDGTLGIKAIKENGGITMAQDDKSAKFDGMPRSSVSTGLVDVVLPPKLLADELVSYVQHPFVNKTKKNENFLDLELSQLKKVIQILYSSKNVDFSSYKENTIIRRIEKRISLKRFDRFEDYTSFLTNNPNEIDILFNELFIGVTRFFRDEAYFNSLKENVIPKIIEKSSEHKEIRIWITACSTGEEAYSIAILFREYLDLFGLNRNIKIFATDIDSRSLTYASAGFYLDNIISDVSADRLSKYFVRNENGYQISDSIRNMLIFAKHNLTNDPPFSKMDLITCRNLLIYLNNDIQFKIISIFNLSIRENGFLFLGSSESLGAAAEGFSIIDSKSKIFQKKLSMKPGSFNFSNHSVSNSGELLHLTTSIKNPVSRNKFLEDLFDKIMGDYLPPSVIIDKQFEIVHTIGNVNTFLRIPIGQVSLNLLKMLPLDLSLAVSSIIRRADKNDNDVEIVIDNIESSDHKHSLKLTCRKIKNRGNGLYYFMVVFEEDSKKVSLANNAKVEKIDINLQFNERIDELEKELQIKSESLQATVEELETSNEELQSSNEELIAANEELQSTNEELQSVNEELYTVNSEHIRKIDELIEMTADFENLLKNTKIGHLYLDTKLNIRKINEVAVQITNILVTDNGRPINHLSLNNLYSGFVDDIHEVSETLQSIEKDIEDKKGNWYLMRIFPYRTTINAIEGIIITFIEINKLKNSQNDFSIINNRLERSLEMGEMSWWEWDLPNNIVLTGSGKHEMLGFTSAEIGEGYEGWTKLLHPDDLNNVMKAMENLIKGVSKIYFVEYRILHKKGHYIHYRDKGTIVSRDKLGNPVKIAGIVMKVDFE
jgi:two-component system, chemotaxis family, CheB/CheR fusion protein